MEKGRLREEERGDERRSGEEGDKKEYKKGRLEEEERMNK